MAWSEFDSFKGLCSLGSHRGENFAPPLFSLGIYCSALGGSLCLRISRDNDKHNGYIRGLKYDDFKPPGSVPRVSPLYHSVFANFRFQYFQFIVLCSGQSNLQSSHSAQLPIHITCVRPSLSLLQLAIPPSDLQGTLASNHPSTLCIPLSRTQVAPIAGRRKKFHPTFIPSREQCIPCNSRNKSNISLRPVIVNHLIWSNRPYRFSIQRTSRTENLFPRRRLRFLPSSPISSSTWLIFSPTITDIRNQKCQQTRLK